MAVLPILLYPNPKLRIVAEPVLEVNMEIKQLIQDMIETMYQANGIGLAATQVDRHVQVIVMDLSEDRNEPRVFINPKITMLTDNTKPYQEGCLSIPSVYDDVERPTKVKIEALDGEGNAFVEEAEELLAICIQHEIDHLNGKLFVDYLSSLKQERARNKVKKHERIQAKINSKKKK